LKQLVILSGKGGTGKTSLAATFAHLAQDERSPIPTVLVDADVDAANLELVLHPQILETHDFIGGSVAVIDAQRCQQCGVCQEICRFDAIQECSEGYLVDPIACDGCAACAFQCPDGAILMQPQIVGQWYHSESHYGHIFHANLHPAQENSGKLVTVVKQNARLMAMDTYSQLILVDGPPGIGCPVISTIAGANLVLVVTEPTSAGIHDMKRVLDLAYHFRLPALVCINKFDIYPAGFEHIVNYCDQHQIEVVGSIPFDETVTRAMIEGEPVTVYQPAAPASLAISRIWLEVFSRLHLELEA